MGLFGKSSENEQLEDDVKDSVKNRENDLVKRIPQYKPHWNKNGVIQYKDDVCAILQRAWGKQVEFIIAFSDLSKEGFTLIAIDEGKTGSQGNIAGGVNSYYYFQKVPTSK